MLSSQLNFYVAPDEAAWFDELLRSAGHFCVVTATSRASKPELARDTVLRSPGVEALTVHLVRDSDMNLLEVQKIENREGWFVDVTRSPVIELSRCFLDGRVLRRGRLYVVKEYFGHDGTRVIKDAGFLSWSQAVLACVRRALIRRSDGDYVAPITSLKEGSGEMVLRID